MTLDLNADMGESFGLYRYGEDEAIVRSITSANLACGFHAGDPTVMRRSILLAKAHNVAVGAHFGFRDLVGFGRRELSVRPSDLRNEIVYQLGALNALAQTEDVRLHHVKPHGALYMMGLEDAGVAAAIVEAVASFDDSLPIYSIHDSETAQSAERQGLRVIPEFFADRPYHSNGQVKMFGTSLDDLGGTPDSVGERIAKLIRTGNLPSIDGKEIQPVFKTICVHSDTPNSAEIASAIRKALENEGVELKATA